MDYDILWKGIIEDLFKEFISFFMPELYKVIDFSAGYEFLDQELAKLMYKSENEKMYTDKLAKVYLNNGEEKWILIHIEVQGYRENEFSERMFRYFYRLYDKYQKKISAIAIFTDENKDYKPDKYEYDFYNTRLIYEYDTYKLLDQDENELMLSGNPFSLAVLAGLYVIKSKKDIDQRFQYKVNLIRLLVKKGYTRIQIEKLFIFIDNILYLPKEEALRFETEVKHIISKEGDNVGLTWDDSNLAKVYKEIGREEGREQGREEGREQGREEGREQGREEGIAKGKIDLVIRLLQKKFGDIPAEYTDKISQLNDKALNDLVDNIFTMQDISEICKYIS